MTETLRVGVVGSGGVANRHLGVLARVPGVQVVGHVSADVQRARGQATRWGGAPFDRLEPFLDRARPDAVWLCLTPDRHGPPERALIERAIPFFVEKPLAADLATPEAIAAEVLARRLVVGVGYKLRALDVLERARDLLAERPARLVLGAWHDATPSPPWWRVQARSGGQVVEQATHLVDLARLLVGEAEVVGGVCAPPLARPRFPGLDVADVTAALLRFNGSVPGVLTATCLLDGKAAAHLQCIAEGRMITVSETRLRIESGSGAVEEIPVRVDPFLVEDQAFIHAVRRQDPGLVLSSYADALKTHRLCCAISAAAGGAEQ